MNRKKWFCLLTALACLIFSGCRKEIPESTDPIYTWEQLPQLTFGQMESERLEVLPWHCGQTEVSSHNALAETALGYYLVYDFSNMIYADKADLNNWVYVCGQADCDHRYAVGCHAIVGEEWLLVKDGRIYFTEMTGFSPHLYQTMGSGTIFVSTLPDGTDRRLEYIYEDSLLFTDGRTISHKLGDQWFKAISSMDGQGNQYYKYFLVDSQGGREIQGPGPYGQSSFQTAYARCRLRGEPLVLYGSFDVPEVYRMEGDSFVKLNVALEQLWNGYASGDILRFCRKGGGYFDRNLLTGAEIKIADTWFENGYGNIVAPNCILEVELTDTGRRMALFDGQTWREVALPPELSPANAQGSRILALASDCILLTVQHPVVTTGPYVPPTYDLYRIPLGEEELRMEFCGKIAPGT